MKFALGSLLIILFSFAAAHEVPCPKCGLKIIQNTDTQDNEVVLRFGKKKIEYRCIACVFDDAKRYAGDLIVYAPSEVKGKPVLLQRKDGVWSAVKDVDGTLVPDPDAVFLNVRKGHANCAMQARAFHNQAGFEKYVAENKLKDAKPTPLAEMVKR